MNIEPFELQRMLNDAAELGAKRALTEMGKTKPFISQNQASKIYGRSNVERWIKEGLIKVVKDGNDSAAKRLDRIQLDIISKTNNRATYLTTKERKYNNNILGRALERHNIK